MGSSGREGGQAVGTRAAAQGLCFCGSPPQLQPCSSRVYTSSSLLMAPPDFSVPNQITSGRISLPSCLPASSVGRRCNQPCASAGNSRSQWLEQILLRSPQVPETLWRVKGDSGTRSAEKLLLPVP